MPPSSLFARLAGFAGGFLAVPAPVAMRERWRSALGAGFGIFLVAWLSHWAWSPAYAAVWLVAPMGASAVLVFAVPASPLAQPWPVVAGNTLSALVGISCVNLMGDPVWAAAAAVGLAIALMFALRCLHPPGGASALLVVLTHVSSYSFAVFPVLVNSLLLVLAGVLYNHLTGKAFPHVQRSPAPAAEVGGTPARFSNADLDAALAHYNQFLDVGRDDLADLLHHAELAAYQRNLGHLRCADIMSREPVAVRFGATLHEAWQLMRQHQIKALPVIDAARRMVGIVTFADFLRHAGLDDHHGLRGRWQAFLQPSGKTHSDKPEVVGQIMTRKVQVTSVDRYVIELVPLFSQGGHHHLPVIDPDKRLVGIITQRDLLRALYRAVQQPDSATVPISHPGAGG